MKNVEIEFCDEQEWWGHTLKRIKVQNPRVWSGVPEVDEALTNYEIHVASPKRSGKIPVLISTQGITAPINFSFYQIKQTLDMGIAWVGIDTPFAGSRTITNGRVSAFPAVFSRLRSLGVDKLGPEAPFELMHQDFLTLAELVLPDLFEIDRSRVALVGVSFGAMLSSWSFINQQFGERMIGLIGHGNIFGLGSKNPLNRADQVNKPRSYHLMLGADDSLIDAGTAKKLIERMPAGSLEIAQGVSHGGGRFEEASLQTIYTRLTDWSTGPDTTLTESDRSGHV